MNAYFSILIITLLSFGCKKAVQADAPPAEQEQVVPTPTKKNTPPNVRYGINYPEGWTIENGYNGTASMALSEIRKSTNSRATMNIAISNTTVETPKEVYDLALMEYEKSIPEMTDIVDRPLTLATGVKAHEVTFVATLNKLRMRFRIIHSLRGGLAFIVTAASVVDTFEEDNRTYFEPAFQTFFLRDAMGTDVKRKYYSIKFPEGWDAAEVKGTDTSAIAPGEPGKFSENIGVDYGLVANLDLKAYTTLSINELKTSMEDFKLISQREFKLENGRSVSEMIFDHKNGEIVFRGKMIHTIEKGMGYIILLTAKPDTLERYEAEFNKTVESFQPHRD